MARKHVKPLHEWKGHDQAAFQHVLLRPIENKGTSWFKGEETPDRMFLDTRLKRKEWLWNLDPPQSSDVLTSIYTTHYPQVLQVCRRFFRQPEDAEDAAAEVFLKLHTVLEKKDEEHPFRPWVCQLAGRHCIDKLRRQKLEKFSIVDGIDLCVVPDVSTPSPLSRVLHQEAKRQVSEQLNRLPDYYKVPLVLRYYKQMSYSEIASTLNRRLPAVKTIIFRAKNRLRRDWGARQSRKMCMVKLSHSRS